MKSNFSRRDFIRTSSAISAGVVATGCQCFHPSKKKPNLLFIWTDQQRADTMAVYGNKKIKTPNLNRLAEQCFVFQKAYVTQPVSTPSRSSVMTGLYPHTSGLTHNNVPLPREIPCFPELLNDSEYKIAYMGKWHLGDEVFAQHGFETWISIEDGYTDYFYEDRDRSARSDYHHWLVGKGYQPDRMEENKFSRNFAASLPLEHCKPKFLEEKACKYLDAVGDDPFILYVNFLEPHSPYTGPFNDLHPPESINLSGNFHDSLDDRDPLRYRLQRERNIATYGPDEKEFRSLISKYWGLVSQVDQSVGAILDKLEKLGMAENTIVVYTSDHGDMMGSHKMVTKTVMFEESVRIPFMMRIPQITTEQILIKNRRVSQIDIVPTLLDLLGKNIPASLEGKSLVPLLKGKNVPEDYVFIEWNPADYYLKPYEDYNGSLSVSEDEIRNAIMAGTRTVISPDGWKLCLRDTDLNQLFDLNADPLETTNLFNDAAYKDKIEFLTEKIKEWQISTNDTLKIG